MIRSLSNSAMAASMWNSSLPLGVRGVDVLVEHDQLDLGVAQLADDLDQVGHRPADPVELHGDQVSPGWRLAKHLVPLRAAGLGAAHALVGEHQLSAVSRAAGPPEPRGAGRRSIPSRTRCGSPGRFRPGGVMMHRPQLAAQAAGLGQVALQHGDPLGSGLHAVRRPASCSARTRPSAWSRASRGRARRRSRRPAVRWDDRSSVGRLGRGLGLGGLGLGGSEQLVQVGPERLRSPRRAPGPLSPPG